ncbi:hypothetical protein GALL_367270 [mine drainage metagenome]|uniref:NAD-specific glutamate dehydrogenase n=1 Tax=mine drainage metagenome TaxID=410659 RepID=A0A1J5QD05_9ZZZZ
MRGGAAVGVDDDLAPGEPAVALRPADDEAPGGVDEVLDLAAHEFVRQHGLDDVLDDAFAQIGHLDVGRVLGGQHDGVDGDRAAVLVAEGDLALGVRAQPGQAAVTAQLALALHQAVRVVDGRGHQLGGFVAGVAEHQALVARPLVEVVVVRAVDALGDVGALLVVGDQHGAALVVDAEVGVVVADALEGVARHLDVVDHRVGGDLAGQHDEAGVGQGFGGDARARVLFEDGVEDGVRNLVGHLVGMALGHGFGGEEEGISHGGAPVGLQFRHRLRPRTATL